MRAHLDALGDPGLVATREALRSVACYVVSPARRAVTGRIGLRPVGQGLGTPPFDDATDIRIDGDELVRRDGARAALTTVRAGAAFLDVELSADPGVGTDLPELEPDTPLRVDPRLSRALGAWYEFGQQVLSRLPPGVERTEAQLWPEHFDLATVVTLTATDGSECAVNVGVSPGDGDDPQPYVYVGPQDGADGDDPYWNRPYGAALTLTDLAASDDPVEAAAAFVAEGLDRLRR